MILVAIINTLYYLLYALTSPFRLLPDVTLPVGFTSAITTANGYIKSLDQIVPIDTLLVLIALYVSIELAYFGYKFTMWVIKRLPTQS